MRTGLCSVGVIVSVLGFASSAYAQDDAFKKGMDARGDRKWADVIAQMQEAIRLDPRESTRKVGGRFGFGGDEYLPHFHLGEAFLERNECAAALAAWDESERQAVVRRNERNLQRLQQGVAACESKGFLPAARLQSEGERAAAAIKAATGAEQDVAALRAAQSAAVTAQYRAMTDRARTDLAGAREKLSSGRTTRRAEEITDAIALAESARVAYVAARGMLEKAAEGVALFGRRADDVERALDDAARTAQATAALLKSAPLTFTPPAALIDARRKAADAVGVAQERLTAARRSGAEADLADAQRLAAAAGSAVSRVHGEVEGLRRAAIDAELRTLSATAGEAFVAIETRLAAARETAVSRPPDRGIAERVEAEFGTIGTNLARIKRRFERAAASADLAGARSAAGSVAELDTQLDALGALLGGPQGLAIPAALRVGAQSFFEGRYREALDALSADPAAVLSSAQRVHAHVLRAAAWFALYEYSGRRDGSLRDAARREADASRRLNPAFQPNPQAFAPKFLAFFAGGEPASD